MKQRLQNHLDTWVTLKMCQRYCIRQYNTKQMASNFCRKMMLKCEYQIWHNRLLRNIYLCISALHYLFYMLCEFHLIFAYIYISTTPNCIYCSVCFLLLKYEFHIFLYHIIMSYMSWRIKCNTQQKTHMQFFFVCFCLKAL